MSRRVNMPAAEDLFRPTAVPDPPEDEHEAATVSAVAEPAPEPPPDVVQPEQAEAETGVRGASGRVRHQTKMTVYVTEDELLDLEHARLQLRRRHGVAVDRGRLVREAVALALADLDDGGEDSALVRRLAGE